MSQEKLLEIVREMLAAYREKRPTTSIALIAAVSWLATVYIVGKVALLLAIPATLIALVREVG